MHRHAHLDVFDVDVHLVTTQRDLASLLKELTDEPTEWDSLGQVQTYHGGAMGKEAPTFHAVVCLDRKVLRKDRALMLRTVAHEATNAAGMTLDYLAEEYGGGSETLAYLVGWLTGWIWEAVA